VDNGGVAPPPPPPSCKDLDTSLRKVEAASTKAGKASFSARKKYFAAKRVWLADPTSANKKKKNSALKTLRKYQKQVKTLKKQIVAGTALLTKSKCSCELSSRTLSKYNASLNKDRAALKKAKKAEKKAIGLPTFPKLHRATEKLQGKARLEKAKIKLIVAERTKNKCK
jgi:hypothetical protein